MRTVCVRKRSQFHADISHARCSHGAGIVHFEAYNPDMGSLNRALLTLKTLDFVPHTDCNLFDFSCLKIHL
ncbi:hypothetical protein, partial [Chryseosolibacter indicus]